MPSQLKNKTFEETKQLVESVGKFLISEGFSNSDAYPVKKWKKLGFPETIDFFKAVDYYLGYFRRLNNLFNGKTKER